MEDQKVTTEAEAVSNLALAAQGVVKVEVLEVDGTHYIFTENAAGGVDRHRIVPTDDYGHILAKPSRIRQGVTVETADSLVNYVRDFKVDGTRLFASISTNVILAVLDYHEGRTTAVADLGAEHSVGADDEGKADHADHTVTLRLPYSEEWGTWTGQDQKLMSQLDFARFIQENGVDILSPDRGDLLDIVRDLRGTRKKKFTGDLNLNGGDTSFEYEDRAEVSAKDSVAIPDAFTLRLPVFFGGELVELQAQLRHDVTQEGELKLGYKLLRRESVRQATFKAVVQDVADRSGAPAVYGTPK